MGRRRLPLPTPDDVIEIRGAEAILKQGTRIVMRVPLVKLVEALTREAPKVTFADGSPIPDSVRYVHTRETATLAVVELAPQVRQVRWVADDSPARHGDGTCYDSVNLAFPFIILLVLFRDGILSGFQQLFYRTRPLSSEQDELFLPNLLNCAMAYGFVSVFCLRKLDNIAGRPLGHQIGKVIEHLWDAGFNESMNAHGSYWERMREENLDPRISSVESWERATEEDPLFMTKISWRNAGVSLRDAIEGMFAQRSASGPVMTASDLSTRMFAAPSNRRVPRTTVAAALDGFPPIGGGRVGGG